MTEETWQDHILKLEIMILWNVSSFFPFFLFFPPFIFIFFDIVVREKKKKLIPWFVYKVEIRITIIYSSKT